MKTLFRKTILFALIAALGLAALPFVGASAAGRADPTPPPKGQISNEKLERIWAHQLRRYNRIGRFFEHADVFTDRVQMLIDRAKTKGKDVSAVQTALVAFKAAVKKARPIYEGMQDIVNPHQGFDTNGKVTDAAKAQATVMSMHGKFKAITEAMNGTGKAVREAIRAFREANLPAQPKPTATPTSG